MRHGGDTEGNTEGDTEVRVQGAHLRASFDLGTPGPLITEAERKEIDTEGQSGSMGRFWVCPGAWGTGLHLNGHAFGFHVRPKIKLSIHEHNGRRTEEERKVPRVFV